MSTHFLSRFGLCFSALLAVAGVSTPSASASAQPTQAKTCRPASAVSDARALKGCAEIVGDVRIEGTTSQTLTELSALRRVKGTLVIANNPHLTSLEGLSSLRSVEGLVVRENPVLETVQGLDALTEAPRVEFTGNRALDVLDGLNSLRHVSDLVVRNNGLFRLAGFQSLVSAGNVVIAQNPRLIYTSGLSRLVSVENLSLVKNPRLAPVSISFRSLPAVKKELLVQGCPGISPADLGRHG